jgi:uncharacterized protein YcbK (DUF882 family)
MTNIVSPKTALANLKQGIITGNVTRHFTWREVFTNRSLDDLATVTLNTLENALQHAKKMEEVRAKFNRPIAITSWYRDPRSNREVGGSPRSQHLLGLACDFTVDGLTPKVVQLALENWWEGGLGYGATFTHLDSRANRARFSYA